MSSNDYTRFPGHPLEHVPVQALDAARKAYQAAFDDGSSRDPEMIEPIADAVVLAALPHLARLAGFLTEPDLREMADEMMGNIKPEPNEDELRRVAAANPHLVHKAHEWTWGDTEVRDELAEALEKLRMPPR
jgi:hypothetical protein